MLPAKPTLGGVGGKEEAKRGMESAHTIALFLFAQIPIVITLRRETGRRENTHVVCLT